MISEQQLATWERLANEATEGPWIKDIDYNDFGQSYYNIVAHSALQGRMDEKGNADFIITAREAMPQLIAEVRKLKAKSAQFEREADWLAGRHGTDCVQYIDPHWACRDDKSCDDCWREASKIKAAINE